MVNCDPNFEAKFPNEINFNNRVASNTLKKNISNKPIFEKIQTISLGLPQIIL